jgi:diguanylate cyclase (GGDEF)-like protein
VLRVEVAERKKIEDHIRHLAHHDVLTGLPNRALLEDRINRALAHAQRNHTQFALLFLDLDEFKGINDSLGHRVGDLLLKEVAERLKNSVRDEDTVARQGGDEFILLLFALQDRHSAAMVAQKILDNLAHPLRVEKLEMRISTSIGISVYPSDGNDANTLLERADTAMYRVKQAGSNNYQFYSA